MCGLFLWNFGYMKWLKKIIAYMFIFLCVSNLFFWYAFAACNSGENCEEDQNDNKCASCKATPNWMQMFINFEVDLLWVLQSAGAQPEKVWKNKKSWLFAGGMLSVWKVVLKSTVSKLQQDFDSEIKAVRALRISTVLLYKMTLPNIYTDAVWFPLAVLYKNEPFFRDYKTLQEVDMSADDIIWEMWINWLWDKQISTQIYKRLDTLQSKYTVMYWGNNAVFERITISSSVKYKNLLTFVLRLNSMLKTILYNVSSQEEVEWFVSTLEKHYSKWNIVVVINRDLVDLMIRDYDCATKSLCNSDLAAAQKQLKQLEKNTSQRLDVAWQWVEDSRSAFKQSLLNIKSVHKKKFSKDEKDLWLSDKQVELLTSAYGIDASELTTSQWETLGNGWTKTKEEFVSLKEAANNIKKWTVDLYHTWKNSSLLRWMYYAIKNRWKNKQKKYEQQLSEQERQAAIDKLVKESYNPLSDRSQEMLDEMQDAVDQILLDKYLDKQIALVSTNRDTHYFREIWEIIHKIIEEGIWEKDGDWLVKNLWEACVYQCTNKWTLKCYAK